MRVVVMLIYLLLPKEGYLPDLFVCLFSCMDC